MVRNQINTKNVLTSIKPYKTTFTTSYNNLPYIQASDISNSKRTWCVLRFFGFDLYHLQTTRAPITRLLRDCNPIRAFEAFDISKEPINKISRFWMFWYKRGCNWLGAIKGMALWSRGFSHGSLFKTWPKPETAHEKPVAPRVQHRQQVTDLPPHRLATLQIKWKNCMLTAPQA